MEENQSKFRYNIIMLMSKIKKRPEVQQVHQFLPTVIRYVIFYFLYTNTIHWVKDTAKCNMSYLFQGPGIVVDRI